MDRFGRDWEIYGFWIGLEWRTLPLRSPFYCIVVGLGWMRNLVYVNTVNPLKLYPAAMSLPSPFSLSMATIVRPFATTSSSQRVAIVTGAARGLGRAIALRLAKDGFDLVLNDMQTASKQLEEVKGEITGSGRQALVCPGDVSKESDVKNLVQQAADGFGSLDVVSSGCNTFQFFFL